jgi:hypothetical protein
MITYKNRPLMLAIAAILNAPQIQAEGETAASTLPEVE